MKNATPPSGARDYVIDERHNRSRHSRLTQHDIRSLNQYPRVNPDPQSTLPVLADEIERCKVRLKKNALLVAGHTG